MEPDHTTCLRADEFTPLDVQHVHEGEFGWWVALDRVSPNRGIVHVSSHHPSDPQTGATVSLSGRELARVERTQRAWIAKGYGVAPVPVDGQAHEEDTPCCVCSANRVQP